MARGKKQKFPTTKRSIDLHGWTVEDVEHRLHRALADEQAPRSCWIKVVTGRGLHSSGPVGVLRQRLPKILQRAEFRPVVAEWRQATPGEGGDGAIMVRLRARPNLDRYS